jgi:general secretion pathway protein L
MNQIEKLQNDLSQWYEASSINQFVRWWKSELKSFVPTNYQEKLFPQPIKVFLTPDEDTVNVWRNQNHKIERYNTTVTGEGEPEQWWHQVQHIINQADGKQVRVEYLVPNEEALIRKIALPEAAKENLEEVIGFELDKYVPFNPEQVQISYKINKGNSNSDKILMDLIVLPKPKIEKILNLSDGKSVQLDGIDINMHAADQEPRNLGVNLLPSEKRKSHNHFNFKLNFALIIVLSALIYFVMYSSLVNKQNKVDRLSDINTELQKQARTSKLLRKELKEVIVSSKFLQNKKQERPALVTIFSEVTSILPDHTYITRLKVTHEDVEITGMSDNANILVPLLNKSNSWFSPHLVGGIRQMSRENKEKFTIKAALNEPQNEGEDGSNT